MKTGVIGTGSMGEKHIRTYLSLQDKCQLAGIYDTDTERAKRMAEQYKIKAFARLEDLLEAADAVSIAVPTPYHYETALACIQAKVHMLIEKPFTETAEQAELLIERAKDHNVLIQVGHIELFNPVIHLLRSLIVNENIIAADIRRLNMYDPRTKDTDVIQDLMIHDIYLLKELFSMENCEIYGSGIHRDGSLKYASVLIALESGETAHLTASLKSEQPERSVRIMTEQSIIKADLLTGKIIKATSVLTAGGEYVKEDIQTFQAADDKPLTLELLDFIQCAEQGSPPQVTGEEGLKAIQLTERIRKIVCKNVCRKF